MEISNNFQGTPLYRVTPKFNKMTLRLENNETYKQSDEVTDATMARCRYFVEVYADV